MKRLVFLFCLITLSSCKKRDEALTAQMIVDKAIGVSCQVNCEDAEIKFVFRTKNYHIQRNAGRYRYERISIDSLGVTTDVLTNDGFARYKNDSLIVVSDSMSIKYSNSINSVVYFVQLPFGLNAPAAKKKLLGELSIKGEVYYKILVSFDQVGGGVDYEDVFVYWVHKKSFTVDYFAYSYKVDGGGMRFREAYNPRQVNGIRFVDYNNYKPLKADVSVTAIDALFEAGALKLLSKIETERIEVQHAGAN